MIVFSPVGLESENFSKRAVAKAHIAKILPPCGPPEWWIRHSRRTLHSPNAVSHPVYETRCRI